MLRFCPHWKLNVNFLIQVSNLFLANFDPFKKHINSLFLQINLVNVVTTKAFQITSSKYDESVLTLIVSD